MPIPSGKPDPRFTNALLVVAKRPAAGRTKTRLTPPLSPEQAAKLYEGFLRDTLAMMRQIPGVVPVLAYLPAQALDYFAELAPDFEYILQQGANLGERLDHCLTCYLQRGYRNVAIMSSDTPTLPAAYVQETFRLLDQGADVVIGPCDDGGYYLIGLKRPAPRLLKEVRMSTAHVTADTLALAEEEGLRAALLPTWFDVDDAAALQRLSEDLQHSSQAVGRFSRAVLQGLPMFAPVSDR